jgi:MtN3 and saliva related transmembrane protein
MTGITILGLLAGTLTTISFIPQVLKVIQTKSTRDISLLMFICFSTGVLSWLVYGLFIQDIPVIAANFITFILAVIILIYKIKYK